MKYLGYQKIQIAVISHMDIDHYSGIKELLEMGKIKYLGLPEIPKDETMKKIIGIAKKRGTTIFYLSRGRQITTKDGSLKVLHPQKNSQMEKNAASLVMQGKILGYRVLLTGDVEKEGEEELLSEELERADILKAAHHGSKNSTSNEFLQKVQPKQTVIRQSTPGCSMVPPRPVTFTRPAISSGARYPASVALASQKMILTNGTSFAAA